jgi:hypothetical protein
VQDLAAVVRAQLDAAQERTRELLAHAQQTTLTLKDPRHLGKFIPGWHDWPDVEQMCTERLAEIDATRGILDEHTPRAPGYACPVCWDGAEAGGPVDAPCPTVRLLAQPYAGQHG